MKKYVLPTYAVNIDVPSRVAIPDVVFPVTVEALYTFGEAVEGEAIVTFYKYEWQSGGGGGNYYYEDVTFEGETAFEEPMVEEEPMAVEEPMASGGEARRKRQAFRDEYWWGGSQVRVDLYQKIVQIDSQAVTFDVNIANDLKVTYEQNINVDVVFTEKLTGKTATAIGSVYIASYSYELLLSGDNFYEAGVPYNITISARKIGSGTPVIINKLLEHSK